MFWIAVAILFAVGFLLAAIGFRGRLTDLHPYCRKCRFDLMGRPADSERCSECGTDLRPHAILTGRRVRFMGRLVAGLVFMLFSVSLASMELYAQLSNTDLMAHTPLFWLRWEAEAGTSAVQDAAFADIDRRQMNRKLSLSQENSLAEAVLTLQADLTRPWDGRWGDLMEGMHVFGTLSAEQWERYLRQSCREIARIRPVVGADETITVQVGYAFVRDGNGALNFGTRLTFENFVTMAHGKWAGWMRPEPPTDTPVYPFTWHVSKEVLANQNPGPQVLHFHLRNTHAKTERGEVTVEKDFDLPFTLLGPREHSVRLHMDPGTTAEFARAFRVEPLEWYPQDRRIVIDVHCVGAPMDCGFDVSLTDGKREWPVTSVAYHAGEEDKSSDTAFDVKDIPPEQVDVVFRASQRAAAATMDITDIWGGEFRLKGIAVKRMHLTRWGDKE